jgi:fructan beta-fructosidase
MVVALSDRHKVRFYSSTDLKKWKPLGEFGGQGSTDGGVWECPDLFALPVGGRMRWVLSVGVSGGAPAGGNGTQYFIGDFDGAAFHNAGGADTVLWADHGPDFYAAQSWSNVPPSDGRRILIGWMTNFRYAPHEPTKPWRGTQSLPRELSLVLAAAGPRLAQAPVRELSALRGEPLAAGEFAAAGQALEIEAMLDAGKDARLAVCAADDARTVIGYDAARRRVYVDRTSSRPGAPFDEEFPGTFSAPVAGDAGGMIDLRVIVDRTSVEVFADRGLSVITANTFPPPHAAGLEPGDNLKNLRAWRIETVRQTKE